MGRQQAAESTIPKRGWGSFLAGGREGVVQDLLGEDRQEDPSHSLVSSLTSFPEQIQSKYQQNMPSGIL